MRTQKNHPEHINQQIRYYQILLKSERSKKAFILKWIKRHHHEVYLSLLQAIDKEKERKYLTTLSKFDLLLQQNLRDR